MAPSRHAAPKSVPSKDPRHSRSEHGHERRIYSVSEAASQDDDSASVISGHYETDSGIEDTPPDAKLDRRREREYRPAAPVAQQTRTTRGIQFDRLNRDADTSLTRVGPQTQVMRGEVQRRESDAIQPVQRAEEPAKTALSLRLDLNLDIEVDLKASIRGDLTLTLL